MNDCIHRRTFVQSALALAATPFGSARADADGAAPPGKVLFGFPPGAATVKVGRALLKELQGHYEPDLGLDFQYVIGGTGARCIDALGKAPPDGATAMYMRSDMLTLVPAVVTRAAAARLAKNEPMPVAAVAELTFAFTVGPLVPAEVRSMADYLTWVAGNPQHNAYGVSGNGSAPHFIGMALARIADAPLVPVYHQGQAPQIEDLMSGALPAAVLVLTGPPDPRPDAPLRPLAVSSAQRWPLAPGLPTLRELGLSDIDPSPSMGLFLPAGTPPAKVQALNAAVQAALRSPALGSVMNDSLMRARPGTPQDYAAALALESSAWAQVVKRERFSIQG